MSPVPSRLAVAMLLVSTLIIDSPEPVFSQTTDNPKPATTAVPENPFPNRPIAPAGLLDGGAEWLNTSKPLSLKDLRGKIVVIDFWTYCCINCIHVLPDLKYLEKKYKNEVVVIGCHSAKFENEKVGANIRDAVMRYEIEHPVVNDNEMAIWGKFGIRSWPTIALIDPEGRYIGSQPGEGNRELLDGLIARMVDYHRAKGTLNETPMRFDLEKDKAEPTPLRYPGKVMADEAGGRLFISDSNHNRIVVAGLDGTLQQTIGSGRLGMQDGPFEKATFDHPQGMTLIGDQLYIADTENHSIRIANLTSKTVSTLAGTGEQSRVRIPRGSTDSMALNSPWALQHVDNTLFVAMAGPHQLWAYKLGSASIGVFAGSGREDILNGPLAEAALAQPSGITTDGSFLYVVDSEGSSIRKIGTTADAVVETIVGTSELPRGQSLFAFGDVDGIGAEARLQHPLGIVYHDGTLYVADSYNHRIKRVFLKTNETSTWIGNGKPGDSLDPPTVSEPAGVTYANGNIYIADTNNHRICVANIQTGAMTLFEVQGLTPPKSTAAESSKGRVDRDKKSIALPKHVVGPADTIAINVNLAWPEGYKLNPIAPVIWEVFTSENEKLIDIEKAKGRQEATIAGEKATFNVPATKVIGKTEIEFTVSWEFCKKGEESVCKRRTERWTLPLEVVAERTTKPLEVTVDSK